MNFLCAVVIKEFHRFSHLGAAYDGIIHKQQFFIPDQLLDGDLLHVRDPVTVLLVRRHEASRPVPDHIT